MTLVLMHKGGRALTRGMKYYNQTLCKQHDQQNTLNEKSRNIYLPVACLTSLRLSPSSMNA